MKTKKPAKRRASAGEKMVMKRLAKTLPGICNGIDDLRYKDVLEQPRSDAKEHDRAIRAAVRETWFACENHESENSESHKAQIKGQIEQRFGVKL